MHSPVVTWETLWLKSISKFFIAPSVTRSSSRAALPLFMRTSGASLTSNFFRVSWIFFNSSTIFRRFLLSSLAISSSFSTVFEIENYIKQWTFRAFWTAWFQFKWYFCYCKTEYVRSKEEQPFNFFSLKLTKITRLNKKKKQRGLFLICKVVWFVAMTTPCLHATTSLLNVLILLERTLEMKHNPVWKKTHKKLRSWFFCQRIFGKQVFIKLANLYLQLELQFGMR